MENLLRPVNNIISPVLVLKRGGKLVVVLLLLEFGWRTLTALHICVINMTLLVLDKCVKHFSFIEYGGDK